MRSTFLISLTFLVLATGTLAANVICYHPQPLTGLDPLAPITVSID